MLLSSSADIFRASRLSLGISDKGLIHTMIPLRAFMRNIPIDQIGAQLVGIAIDGWGRPEGHSSLSN
jgi:hypothetical protein